MPRSGSKCNGWHRDVQAVDRRAGGQLQLQGGIGLAQVGCPPGARLVAAVTGGQVGVDTLQYLLAGDLIDLVRRALAVHAQHRAAGQLFHQHAQAQPLGALGAEADGTHLPAIGRGLPLELAQGGGRRSGLGDGAGLSLLQGNAGRGRFLCRYAADGFIS